MKVRDTLQLLQLKIPKSRFLLGEERRATKTYINVRCRRRGEIQQRRKTISEFYLVHSERLELSHR